MVYSIVSQSILSIASFLDPRFQNLTIPDDLPMIKVEIQKLCPIDKTNISNTIKSEKLETKKPSNNSAGIYHQFVQ